MPRRLIFVLLLLVLPMAFAASADARGSSKKASQGDPTPASPYAKVLDSLEWREVGPYRGGRSAAVTGIADQPNTYYFGATGGGVWKTVDAGKTWDNVSDGYFGGSIGAVEVSPWDPNVVYVGGGEKTVRGNVSHGDGVWKSLDAGKTWRHMGLADSRHIPRLRVHPKNPDLVYAAALGHLYGPNDARGVYRSRDGGETWENILFVSREAGAVDLAMDPTNPRILYASFWRVLRTPWSLESGGEGSGLWKSTDGGDTWQELTHNPGLPTGPIGISGITVSPSRPDNLYAIIEAGEGGVFRSRDGGDTWEKTNDERKLRQRAWYYTRIYADPADEEVVYVLNVRFHRSNDGGRSFRQIPTPHGDNHDLWIDPADPLRMIEGNDGGANVSFDGGKTWSPQDNQPTAQMYRVSTDNAFPYRLLGGQQDNSAIRIRARSAFGSAIGQRDWEPTAGGESGHIVAKPDDPDIVYGGSYGGYLTRVDHRTGERRAVNVWPDDPMGWGAEKLTYRFQWNFPIFFSPHDPDRLYAAANVLFTSTDAGHSWQAISPDLTRNDPSKMGPSGGPITKDNTSVEYYGTLFAALESPHRAGVLWVGSDDGRVHRSDDGGGQWQDVTPAKLPQWLQINDMVAHPFAEQGVYLAATGYKLDDFRPYLYKTVDGGTSWQRITGGIAEDHFTRAIAADDVRQGLLFAGTERGVYVSFNDGGAWHPLPGLPVVPVTDLEIKENDLVVATQGRGYWILDDLPLLRQLDRAQLEDPMVLFEPRPAYRLRGGRADDPGHRGTNPRSGAVFRFWLSEELLADMSSAGEPAAGETAAGDAEPSTSETLRLEIFEADGDLIRGFSGSLEEAEGDDEDEDRLQPLQPGLNVFSWDLRYPQAESFDGMILWNGNLAGPRALPGTYRAVLSLGERKVESEFQVLADPRSSATAQALAEQFEFILAVRDRLNEVHREIDNIRRARQQLDDLSERLEGDDALAPVVEAADTLSESLTTIEKALYQTQNRSRQDPLNFPIRLNDKLAGLIGLADFGDHRPTVAMQRVRQELDQAIETELEALRSLWQDDLAALNRLAEEHRVPFVSPASPESSTD